MTEDDVQKRLSNNLKRIRKSKGLTQESLAEKAHISTQMINDIEGCRRWPSTKSVTKIVNALDCDVQDLFLHSEQSSVFASNIKNTICKEINSLVNQVLSDYASH